MSVVSQPGRRLASSAARAPGESGRPSPHVRLEAWLWTGPAGHLIGGALDFTQALARYALAQRRRPADRDL